MLGGLRTGGRCFLGMVISGAITFSTNCAYAQITPDKTLPNNSTVRLDGNTHIIEGGTRAGGNLFHSFQQFSVPNGSTAFFNNATDIQNIFSRVTGGSVSNIDGLIRANPTANLFLINPNGIIFGKNASLNIGGSFVGSTANSLKFADGTEFSASTPQTTPLLTISVPIGLQFGTNPGSIQTDRAGLLVKPGQTLALVGGDIILDNGNLTTPAGRIELGSVGSNSLVSLSLINSGWKLGYEGIQNFQDIKLSQSAQVTTNSSDGSGDIQVQGRSLTLTDGSAIVTSASGPKPVGNLTVNTSDSVNLTGGINGISGLLTEALGNGNGGNLMVKTGQLIVKDGAIVRTGNSQPSNGNAGNLTVSSPFIQIMGTNPSVVGFSQLSTGAYGTGAAGNLSITTERLILKNGGLATTNSLNQKNGGNLIVDAKNGSVELSGTSNNGIPSALFSSNSGGGRGGDLVIKTGTLSVKDGAVVITSAFSEGKPGNLNVNATDSVTLTGIASSLLNIKILASLTNTPEIFWQVVTDLTGGKIPSSLVSGIQSAKESGNINITTPLLSVSNGSQIFASNQGTGNAGNLDIKARVVLLNQQGKLTAQSASGNGGNINLKSDLLLLRRGALISTTAGTAQQGGDGGKITINAPNGFIVAVPNENSDIRANAFNGSGGQVQINAIGIFGLTVFSRQDLMRLLGADDLTQLDFQRLPSSITAISQTSPNLSGTVTINTLGIDPTQGLVNLPVIPVDTKVAQGCYAGGSQAKSEFIVTGRGGLPPNPGEPLSTDAVQVDLVTLPNQLAQRHESRVATQSQSQTTEHSHKINSANPPTQIVEAQGWIVNKNGDVELVAFAPTAIPHNPRFNPTSCQLERK